MNTLMHMTTMMIMLFRENRTILLSLCNFMPFLLLQKFMYNNISREIKHNFRISGKRKICRLALPDILYLVFDNFSTDIINFHLKKITKM